MKTELSKTELAEKHGTPAQFEAAVWRAAEAGEITIAEARAAIEKYQAEFTAAPPLQEVLRLDAKGMAYNGQFIEDGGEAHRAFLKVMRATEKQEDTLEKLRQLVTTDHETKEEFIARVRALVS